MYFVESIWLKVVQIPQSNDIKDVLQFAHDVMKKNNVAYLIYLLNYQYGTGSTWKGSMKFKKKSFEKYICTDQLLDQ